MNLEWRVEQELSAAESQAVCNGQSGSFGVEMVYGRHFDSACGCSEGRILDHLEFLYGGIGAVWRPDWSGVVDDRANKQLVGGQECFLVLAPVGAGEGPQDV